MQMRFMYSSVNRAKRALEMRADALECHRAGFAMLAGVLSEEAELLCPSPRENDNNDNRVRKGYRSGTRTEGSNNGGVNRAVVSRGGAGMPIAVSRSPLDSHIGPMRGSASRGGVSAVPAGRGTHSRNHRRGIAASAHVTTGLATSR